jgi:hypothetical protein
MFFSSEQVNLSGSTKSHQKYLTATSGFDILTDVSWFSVERSHSGLVRRFAKPLRGKPLREFESLPLRHRGYAERLRQPSPKRSMAGSTPAAPAEAPNCLGTFCYTSNYSRGNSTTNLLPCPGSDSHQMRPLCRSTISLVMARPRPRPLTDERVSGAR